MRINNKKVSIQNVHGLKAIITVKIIKLIKLMYSVKRF